MQNKSLFIQVGSLSPSKIVEYCEYIRNGNSPVEIYNVALTYIGDRNGNLFTEQLAAIKPYLPGQPKAIFDNVFVGSVADYTGIPDPYNTSMFDSTVRWSLLTQQRVLSEAIASLWSDVTFHWYVEHEAALNLLSNVTLRAAYEAFLVQSVIDLRTIRPNTAILWSPAIWENRPSTDVQNQLGFLFRNIKTHTDGIGINWLHLQDTSGRHWFNPTAQDILAWYKALPAFDSKRINVEQFKEASNGGLTPQDRATVSAREDAYAQLGMPVGFCWEIRHWYGVVTQPVTAPTPALGASYSGLVGGPIASNTSYTNRKNVKEWLRSRTYHESYGRRAAVVADAAAKLKDRFPLEIQGAYYMRPYYATVTPGRAVNSDHLTAGALDIFFRNDTDKLYLNAVKAILNEWDRRGVIRYYIDLGYNWAHRDHIHVSFQIGVGF